MSYQPTDKKSIQQPPTQISIKSTHYDEKTQTAASFSGSSLAGKGGLGLFLVLLLTLAVRFPMLHVPLERDEGGYAYSAWVWSQGGLPYQDAFDNKPPMTMLLYRFSFALFGADAASIHLLMILASLLAAFMLYQLARRTLDEPAALAAAAALALMGAEPHLEIGNAANTELFMLLPIIGAALFLSRGAFLSGLLMGAALMTKQTAVFEAAAFGLWLSYQAWKNHANQPQPDPGTVGVKCTRVQSAGPILLYSLGACVVPLAFCAYFWASGAFSQFLNCVFLYNAAYGSEVARGGKIIQGLGELGFNLKAMAPGQIGIWLLAALGLWDLAANRRGDGWMWGWIIASWLGVSAGFRFAGHYLIQAMPIIALLAGLGSAKIKKPAAAWVLLALPFFLAGGSILISGNPEAVSKSIYDINPFVEAAPLGRYIAENTSPDEQVYIFGSEPEVLFYAKRRSATRFIQFSALTLNSPQSAAMQAEAIKQIDAAKPELFLWVNNPLSFMASEKSERAILDYTRGLKTGGSYELEGLVFVEPDKPSRYFLGRGKVKDFKPEQIDSAQLALYRKKGALNNDASARGGAGD